MYASREKHDTISELEIYRTYDENKGDRGYSAAQTLESGAKVGVYHAQNLDSMAKLIVVTGTRLGAGAKILTIKREEFVENSRSYREPLDAGEFADFARHYDRHVAVSDAEPPRPRQERRFIAP
jgi:hypothetical protein